MSMRMDLGQHLSQKQMIAPRMIQSMEVLQLPIMALQEKIEREMQENPVLELREKNPESYDPADDHIAPEDKFNPDGPIVHDASNESDFKRLEAIDRDWDGLFNEDHRPSRGAVSELGDKKLEAMQNMPSRPQSLQDILAEQLPYHEFDDEEQDRIEYLIADLDERGYLRSPLAELAGMFGKPVTEEQLEDALLMLQKLEPAGVGARDLKECLLLQVSTDAPHRELVRQLILNHLEDVALNRIPNIQKRTGYDPIAIREAIEFLHRLDPKPGAQYGSETTHFVTPDIIVEKNEEGEYTVRLTEDWTPNIRLNRKYVELYKDKQSDPKAREYLKRKITSATWLMDAIQQRRNTLEKVTRAIISHQRSFLDKEKDHIEPLKMQQIADQVKVHVTTVSRAVDDKWVQTSRGVFPLKRFFGGGTKNTETGEDVAWEQIKQTLLGMIADENKASPLSDEDIVNRLKDTGFPVARRTVTKYRKMLKIPSSRQRKQWAN